MINTEAKIEIIKKYFDRNISTKKKYYNFFQKKLSIEEIKYISSIKEFPKDYLLLLINIGEIYDWTSHGCAIMSWWTPCSIEEARRDGRSLYEFGEINIKNGSDLLFFAYDVDAKVYFFDKRQNPWKLVIADGLELSFSFEKKDNTMHATWHHEGSIIDIINMHVEYNK